MLGGNLCPRGAVIKQTAASPALSVTPGPAYVFDNHDEMIRELDREDLPVDENTVLVMKNGGPDWSAGLPGMGLDPDAQGPAQAGHHRHGADLRRAHERHEFRDGGAARDA